LIHFAKTQPERTKKMLQELYRQNDQSVIGKRNEAMVEMFPDYPYITKGAVQSSRSWKFCATRAMQKTPSIPNRSLK
jgi:hypothetical protein